MEQFSSFFRTNRRKKTQRSKWGAFFDWSSGIRKGRIAFDKEQKQDLMHIGICKVLSLGGFYTLEGLDAEGWPHWKQVKEMPHIDLLSQENLLKHYVIRYFQEEIGVHL
jgi:hypothetical protein